MSNTKSMNFKSNFDNNLFSLIQIKKEDFLELYFVAKDYNIWEQHPENDRWKKDKFYIFFNKGLQNNFGFLKIIDKNCNKVIGSTRFYSYDKVDDAIRIGFTFISKEYWGTSTNFLIKQIMIDYAFKYLSKIYFDIGNNNLRSRKAVEKLGAVLFKDSINGNVIYLLKKTMFL